MTTLVITTEFLALCRQIVERNMGEAEWAEIESDDMFQSQSFVGGYDAVEAAFCFSYYDHERREYWFHLSLPEIREVIDGVKTCLDLREPD